MVITQPGADFTVGGTTNLGAAVQTAGGSTVTTDNTTQITFDPTLSGRVQALVTGTLISPATLPAAVGAPVTVRVASGVAAVTLTDAVAETFQVAITNNAGLTNPANDSITVTGGSPTGLVVAYGFEEGSGTTTQDHSGNGNNGTLVNGVGWVAGQVGQAVNFDGTNDYVETGNTANLPNWTISGWVRGLAAPSSANASGPIHRDSNYTISWNHQSAAFRGAAAVQVGGTWHAASFGPLLANTWYYLAATYDGQTLRAYKDGALITSNTAPAGAPTSEPDSLKLGRHNTNAQFFRGTVDEVRVYNRALSLEEIQNDMVTPVAPPP